MNTTTDRTTIELIAANIVQWGIDRNIIGGATAERQFLKLMSEFGEAGDAIAKNDIEGIKDGIGDTFVVLMIIAGILGMPAVVISTLPIVSSTTKFFTYDGEEQPSIERAYARTADRMTYLGLVVGDEYTPSALIDCVKHLSILAAYYDLTLEVCALYAYGEIKDRTGVLFNGTFIKSTDARYDDAMAQIAAQRVCDAQ